MAHAPRNPALVPGVSRFSRSQSYAKAALFKKKKQAAKSKAAAPAATKTKTVGGAKNGKSRAVLAAKAPRFYAAEDAPVPKVTRKTIRPVALRSSITPGTVLIVLSGKFAGKRVVFLKQLASGLLLVTGPFKVNGVPLRRINQAYVIATSTKVDLSGVKVDEKFNDDYFKRAKEGKKQATEEELFEAGKKQPTAEHRVADQKQVDKAILAAVKKTPYLKAYLNSSFSLSKGQFPHLLRF
ncbi:hypothetical protein HK097_000030 [Rhizophlyctis rosea]|uniref:60S ribosomal protein L6 n=1 Tax=Rhizophlyctis rosea TaxID=64517 RepID=A0AAD5SLG0_9FUNG|nr:hypothetical protein HK097_000030 [Rhizophlyctis rosea]